MEYKYQEPSSKGGRRYRLVKAYRATGAYTEPMSKGGRRYDIVKDYAPQVDA